MHKLLPIIISFICVFLCSTLAFSQTYPQRIISLGPPVTEQLYLLEVEGRIVGVTTYCQRPYQAQKKEKIGTVTKLDIEKVLSLKPDLVLATSLTDPKAKEKLANLGIKVVTFSTPKNFKQMYEQFLEIGRLMGKEKEAKEIFKRTNKELVSIKQKIEGLTQPKVIIQIGANPLFVVPKDSFVNDLIELAGGINIGPKGKSGLYSRENIIKDNADIIIIATMGIVGEEEKNIWQRYKTLTAVRDNRIYIIDAYKLCSPTVVSLVGTLKEMIVILHPSLKDKT
ncbi:MAG: ABC transporter substrate-binding protein [bacterium]